MSLFISTAHAAGEAAQQPSMMANILMIAVFVAIFFFLIWRPQSSAQKNTAHWLTAWALAVKLCSQAV